MTRLDRLEVLRDIENIWLVNIYNTLVEMSHYNAIVNPDQCRKDRTFSRITTDYKVYNQFFIDLCLQY